MYDEIDPYAPCPHALNPQNSYVRALYPDPCTHRPRSSSVLGLPYRILNINHKKELLRGLWVDPDV